MYNNFEISLVVFMPNITTNHAITYTNLPVFRQIQDIKAYSLHISFHPLSCFFFNACMHVLRKRFGYFLFEKKRVKFPAIFSSFTKTTERTQPRPQGFSITVPFFIGKARSIDVTLADIANTFKI